MNEMIGTYVSKIRKETKIRNQYNQVLHHKAAINKQECMTNSTHTIKNYPQMKNPLGVVSKYTFAAWLKILLLQDLNYLRVS